LYAIQRPGRGSKHWLVKIKEMHKDLQIIIPMESKGRLKALSSNLNQWDDIEGASYIMFEFRGGSSRISLLILNQFSHFDSTSCSIKDN